MKRNDEQYIMKYDSPVGMLTISSDGEAITGLWIEGQKYYGDLLEENPQLDESRPEFIQTREWLHAYFQGENPKIDIPMHLIGSDFRKEVWDILLQIPQGELMTYGGIAKLMEQRHGDGKRVSAQAVGGAVGHNPISIIVPCHRVVGTNGSLTGYAGGIHLKVKLLELEGAPMEGLFVPKKGTAL